jgi:predicted deacylase
MNAYFEPGKLEPGLLHQLELPVAGLADGSVVRLPLLVAAGRQPGPRIVITAGIHGDEYEGPRVLTDLLHTLDVQVLGGIVVGVPVAHPPAFAVGSRTSPIDGLNLARVFPGDPAGTMTLRIAHILLRHVVEGADLLVDLHSGGVRYHFAQLAGFYPFLTGPGALLARRAALAMGFPYLWAIPANPGVLSYTAAMQGIPSVGAEVSGMGGCLEEDVTLYREGLHRVLALMGMLPGVAAAAVDESVMVWQGDWLLSSASGQFRPHVSLGQDVRQGDLLASILDPFGAVLDEMRAVESGRVLALRHLRSISPGEWAVMVLQGGPMPVSA